MAKASSNNTEVKETVTEMTDVTANVVVDEGATISNLPAASAREMVTGQAGSALADPRDMSLEELMGLDAGKGTSQKAEDNIVPLVYILQTNSPQVNRRSEAYIEGAEPGDIWLRHAPIPIIKGQAGIEFIPCFWWKDLVEWIPRDNGGGFVGRHAYELDAKGEPILPPECTIQRDPANPQKVRYLMKNGNELVLTANHAGFVVLPDGKWMPYVIPLKSTGLTVSRQFMFAMNSKRTRDGRVLPSFSHRYKMITRHRKNKEGEWFVPEFVDGAMLTNDDKTLYLEGRNLEAAFASGAKVAEEEVTAGGEAGAHDQKDSF
jgi:hypothetical protein